MEETKTKRTMLRLKELLSLRGISQQELARRTGITPANINAIVNNKANPSLESLDKIAQAMGVSTKDLFPDNDVQYILCPRCGERIYFGTADNKDNNCTK